MVRKIADAKINGMFSPLDSELALIAHIQSEYRGHVEVVDTVIVLCFCFDVWDADIIDKRRTVLPMSALQSYR